MNIYFEAIDMAYTYPFRLLFISCLIGFLTKQVFLYLIDATFAKITWKDIVFVRAQNKAGYLIAILALINQISLLLSMFALYAIFKVSI